MTGLQEKVEVDIVHRGRSVKVVEYRCEGVPPVYDIYVDSKRTQEDLTAIEVVRWMANAMHEEENVHSR